MAAERTPYSKQDLVAVLDALKNLGLELTSAEGASLFENTLALKQQGEGNIYSALVAAWGQRINRYGSYRMSRRNVIITEPEVDEPGVRPEPTYVILPDVCPQVTLTFIDPTISERFRLDTYTGTVPGHAGEYSRYCLINETTGGKMWIGAYIQEQNLDVTSVQRALLIGTADAPNAPHNQLNYGE